MRPSSRRSTAASRTIATSAPPSGRVAAPKTRKPAAAPLPPPPTDPAELLDTELTRSGLSAGPLLRRPGRRLGFFTVRELLFHLPRRHDDLREMRKLGEVYLSETGRVVAAGV